MGPPRKDQDNGYGQIHTSTGGIQGPSRIGLTHLTHGNSQASMAPPPRPIQRANNKPIAPPNIPDNTRAYTFNRSPRITTNPPGIGQPLDFFAAKLIAKAHGFGWEPSKIEAFLAAENYAFTPGIEIYDLVDIMTGKKKWDANAVNMCRELSMGNPWGLNPWSVEQIEELLSKEYCLVKGVTVYECLRSLGFEKR